MSQRSGSFELLAQFSEDSLALALQYLNERGFQQTGRLPLVAARQWRWGWELEAWKRFRAGLPNIQEVGMPRLYWRAEKSERRRLFYHLTLGESDPELAGCPELQAFHATGCDGLDAGCPLWTVVSRFGRYILRSHPCLEAQNFVYFGDDTLFLMDRSRQLLSQLQEVLDGPLSCLDLCCGSGGVGLSLPPFDGDLLGVDLNPVAIQVAHLTAKVQGLDHYRYRCCDVESGLEGEFDLIFGNPPTLSPTLTGQDVFHATGTLEAFRSLLQGVMQTLKPTGYALLTLFSEVVDGVDRARAAVEETLSGVRGFRYEVRREFRLGGNRRLRHCALELLPASSDLQEFCPLLDPGMELPALAWRR